jgi:hypothetical protein
MLLEVNVDYAVDEYGDWKDICEGVVREASYKLGNNRLMILDRGSPYFAVEVPEGIAEEARYELAATLSAECARVLDLQNELRSRGLVKRLKDAEAAVKEATSLTRQAQDAMSKAERGVDTMSKALEIGEKALNALNAAARLVNLIGIG